MKKLNKDKLLATLMAFDGDVVGTADDVLDTDLHDDHLLPHGCKSYDEWAECDAYELLGKD